MVYHEQRTHHFDDKITCDTMLTLHLTDKERLLTTKLDKVDMEDKGELMRRIEKWKKELRITDMMIVTVIFPLVLLICLGITVLLSR